MRGYALYGGDGNPQHKWTIWWMLFANRQYVIKKIKAPLLKAIIGLGECGSWLSMLIALIQIVRIAKRYPEPTREHTRLLSTHTLLGIQDEFFGYLKNKGRKKLLQAIWRVFLNENEHDPAYEDWISFLVERLVEEVMSGRWQPRLEGRPLSRWWRETPPYGGEHSIIYKLQAHREEILKMIGQSK